MIHYSCDCCQRKLDRDNLRYVVKMEIYSEFDPAPENELAEDRDHLQEIQEILERAPDTVDGQVAGEVYEQLRFDLCPECRQKFMRNPLGREVAKQFDFSKN